jgi:hypothetical protein
MVIRRSGARRVTFIKAFGLRIMSMSLGQKKMQSEDTKEKLA